MIEKNPKVRLFDLELMRNRYGDDIPYTCYRVVGLKRAYYGPGKTDYANGACGLIKQARYPGYCQLCFVYHTVEFVDGTITFRDNGYCDIWDEAEEN